MRYQLAIIGSGPGGYMAAARAAERGLKVICIDKRAVPGGTCLNVGCIPSKALLEATLKYADLEKAKVMGLEVTNASLDFKRLMQRKTTVVEGLVNGVKSLFAQVGVTWLQGEAAFLSPNELEVTTPQGKEVVTADHFLIATGSEPIALPFLPFDEQRVVSSTGALGLQQLPPRLAIIGAGVIGLELASVYRRLGSEVTLVEMLDRLCPFLDPALSTAAQKILEAQGLRFLLQTKVTKGILATNEIQLTLEKGQQVQQLNADVVLVAVGRRPFTKNLKLEKAGLQTDNKGFIPVDGWFKTAVPHIFAIGDVIEGPMLAHRATEEGLAVVDWLCEKRHEVHYAVIPNVTYTHPEIATVGWNEDEAQKAGVATIATVGLFRINSRAQCMNDTEGMLKLLADKSTGRLLGMHIIGGHASELIGQGAIAIEKRMTILEMSQLPIAHPSLSESIKEVAAALEKKRIRA